MTIAIFVSAFFLSTMRAGAAGIIEYRGGVFTWGKGIAFVFDATGYRNRDVRNASIYVGSNFYDLHCTVNKKEKKIVCVTGAGLTRYSGQTGVIHLAGQMFYVTIPYRNLAGCGGSQVMGAMVTFQVGEGEPQSYFLAGQTPGSVGNAADNLIEASGGFLSDPEFSKLECGTPTLPGFLEP